MAKQTRQKPQEDFNIHEFLDMIAPGIIKFQTDVLTELARSKLNVDRLLLREQEGFLSVGPA